MDYHLFYSCDCYIYVSTFLLWKNSYCSLFIIPTNRQELVKLCNKKIMGIYIYLIVVYNNTLNIIMICRYLAIHGSIFLLFSLDYC